MRVFALLLATRLLLLGALALAAPADGQPRRVASLNLCTDELLLLLAAPEQIVSVTHLAQDPAETPLWAAARRHARNDGSLVSAAALRPDLVLTMGGGARDRGRIAERLGMNVLDLPFAASLDDVATGIRRLAGAPAGSSAANSCCAGWPPCGRARHGRNATRSGSAGAGGR